MKLPEAELVELEKKVHGESSHERIRIRLLDYNPDLILKCKDSKLVYALFAYENLVRSKKSSPNL